MQTSRFGQNRAVSIGRCTCKTSIFGQNRAVPMGRFTCKLQDLGKIVPFQWVGAHGKHQDLGKIVCVPMGMCTCKTLKPGPAMLSDLHRLWVSNTLVHFKMVGIRKHKIEKTKHLYLPPTPNFDKKKQRHINGPKFKIHDINRAVFIYFKNKL